MSVQGPFFVDNTCKYRIDIVDTTGKIVLSEMRDSYSSKQSSVKEVMSGQFMGDMREDAIRGNKEQLDRMQLFAAAPELLEALERLLSVYLTSYSAEARKSCWDKAIAAIAKATGDA